MATQEKTLNPRGAGRKPIGDKPRKQVRLSLDESAITELKLIGNGNMSAAVHLLLKKQKRPRG
jgi:hypothetical protein